MLKKGNHSIILSDGIIKSNCLTFGDATSGWESLSPQPYDVFKVMVRFYKNKLFIIKELKMLYREIPSLIGNPLYFKDYDQKDNKENDPNFIASIPQAGGSSSNQNRNQRGSLQQTQIGINRQSSSSSIRYQKGPIKRSINIDEEHSHTKISLVSEGVNNIGIKAKCSSKSDVRRWGKGDTGGTLFNSIFTDDSGSISVTFFKEKCDKYHSLIEPGKVYSITGLYSKKGGRYNSTDHSCELTAGNSTEVNESSIENFKKIHFEITQIKDLVTMEADTKVNLVVIVVEQEEVRTVNTKNGPSTVTGFNLADCSNHKIKISLWGDNPNLVYFKEGSILVLRYARLSVRNNWRSLAFDRGTFVTTEGYSRAIEKQVEALRSQKNSILEGGDKIIEIRKDQNNHIETSFISQIREQCEYKIIQQFHPDPLFYSLHCYASKLKANAVYISCTECKKRKDRELELEIKHLDEDLNCSSCAMNTKNGYAFMGSAKLSDFSGEIYGGILRDKPGVIIYGMEAKELLEFKLTNQEGYLEYLNSKMLMNNRLLIKAVCNEYNNTRKVNYTVVSSDEKSDVWIKKANKDMLNGLKFACGESKI